MEAKKFVREHADLLKSAADVASTSVKRPPGPEEGQKTEAWLRTDDARAAIREWIRIFVTEVRKKLPQFTLNNVNPYQHLRGEEVIPTWVPSYSQLTKAGVWRDIQSERRGEANSEQKSDNGGNM